MKNNTTTTTIRDLAAQDALIEGIIASGEIGTICRNGRTVYYANVTPALADHFANALNSASDNLPGAVRTLVHLGGANIWVQTSDVGRTRRILRSLGLNPTKFEVK